VKKVPNHSGIGNAGRISCQPDGNAGQISCQPDRSQQQTVTNYRKRRTENKRFYLFVELAKEEGNVREIVREKRRESVLNERVKKERKARVCFEI